MSGAFAHLIDRQFVKAGKRREVLADGILIPESNGGNVIPQLQVSVLALPAQGLDGDLQILFEVNRIGNVPAVHGKTLVGAVQPVRADDLRDAAVGCTELLIFSTDVEIPGAAEIVFRTGAADGGKFPIAVHKELDLTLAPPAVIVDTPEKIGANILAVALHVVQNGISTLFLQGILPAELGVEIASFFRNFPSVIVDLVINRDLFMVDVLDGDPGAFIERHIPIAVKGPFGIDADRYRCDLGIFLIFRTGKEITQRNFYRGGFTAVPIHPEDQGPICTTVISDPDVTDDAGAGDIGHGEGFARLHYHRRGDLPTLS